MLPAAAILKEQDFILSSLAPSPGQKRLALVVVLALFLAFLVIEGPLAKVQLPRVHAFVPIYATSMFVNGSITAILLFAQFSILRSRALIAVSSAYLFTALMVIPWMLTFPGVFAPTGLLGAGHDSTVWLYLVWHTGFPTLVIAYALLKDDDPTKRIWRGAVWSAVLASVAVTIGAVVAAVWVVNAADPALPRLLINDIQLSRLWPYAATIPILVSVFAGVALWARRCSVLDLWLTVVMYAYVIEVVLISFPVPARFSIGWYSGRIFGVLSGSLVLFVLLYEITTLYGRLLLAVTAQRREREARLMTGDAVSASIAHEIKQPLAAMTMCADAGRRWLNREVPDLAEATAAFESISANGHRANAVIEGVRAMFKKDASTRTSVDLAEVVAEALRLQHGELSAHRVTVRTESSGPLPQVNADRVQLQQVFVNLISNAIESMTKTDGVRELCVSAKVHESGDAVISVADTGPGIAAKNLDQIFGPLFTTKADGMGMGLSVCRSIIEAHDGQLWVAANKPHGAVFKVLIPASDKAQAGPEMLRAFGG